MFVYCNYKVEKSHEQDIYTKITAYNANLCMYCKMYTLYCPSQHNNQMLALANSLYFTYVMKDFARV